MDKRELRAQARAARRALPPETRAALSARIREHALALPELGRARAVGCYVSVRSEVDTRDLLRALFARGVVLAVPVTLGDQLVFARLNHPWALAPGPHDIPEPRQPWEEVRGDDLDVIIVPGLRLGRDGSRLGNGGGHFDRFLAAHPKALRVALAFGVQLADSVATDPHDQAMDVIVSEEGRLRLGRPA
ncbi:MAG TPA: 5-formyltetrahydrofolate cyclo-ligase [Candidatus Thermoplasmatota archaeon]|nr:5-formyltetrahydrofolate cyclo-ligase [Candidatus Thermoplasmatota archaeon]